VIAVDREARIRARETMECVPVSSAIESPGLLLTLLAFFLVLGPLVFIHELGH